MTRPKHRDDVYHRILEQHLQWYKNSLASYKDAGYSRRDLDHDVLVLLMVEVGEQIWRRDLKVDAVTSMLSEMVADIYRLHPDALQ